VTGNHPTSTGPISRASSRYGLRFNTLVPSINASRVPFQLLDLMQDIIYKYRIVVKFKYWVMHRGLPLLVGLKSGMLVLLSSELWFGASDNPLVTFIWSLEISSADSWEVL
jgi:hypothetical protein